MDACTYMYEKNFLLYFTANFAINIIYLVINVEQFGNLINIIDNVRNF